MDRRVIWSVALALLGLTAASPDAGAQTRAVVELFTSQGCSSCPPADRLLGELAKDPSVVAMSLPIDYWDYLGWKDTLASPANSARQHAYARNRGDREIYTPQAVVNGKVHAPGGDEAAIEHAIAQTRNDPRTLSVPVDVVMEGDEVTVDVGSGTSEGEVWLCELTETAPVRIERGENGGNTLTYHNVVRRRVKLGDWSGKSHQFILPLKALENDVDTVAVLVQGGSQTAPGAMLGAAVAHLHPPQARMSSGG